MKKLMIFVCTMAFVACNNTASVADRTDTVPAPIGATSLSKESELEILDECIANAKDNAGNDLDDARAFALCRCVLLQMQQKYPTADSTELVVHLRDTSDVMQMARECQ